jgi:hypothetical protein
VHLSCASFFTPSSAQLLLLLLLCVAKTGGRLASCGVPGVAAASVWAAATAQGSAQALLCARLRQQLQRLYSAGLHLLPSCDAVGNSALRAPQQHRPSRCCSVHVVRRCDHSLHVLRARVRMTSGSFYFLQMPVTFFFICLARPRALLLSGPEGRNAR